jgi:DNA-binding beta-propeller fold protein YncE
LPPPIRPTQARLGVFAGTGAEALVDGPRHQAAFNQPSDLALVLGHVIVADAEASAIRAVSLTGDPQVMTLVGQGLFTWGDTDGTGSEVRLQHPAGLAAQGPQQPIVYVADSYNHKVKLLDVTSGQVQTLIGTGAPGHQDGDFEEARLNEPEGLAVSEDGTRLYIADTNNHQIRVADLATARVHTLGLD